MTITSARPRKLFHVFSTLNVGGPQVRFATLANKFGPEFEHILFAMDRHYESTKLLHADTPNEIQDLSFEKGSTARNFFKFRRFLTSLRPDILITYNWGAIEWALANIFRSCPHIHVVDGFGPEEADRQLTRRVLFRRLVLSRNTKIIVPSKTLYKITTETWRLKPEAVTYIPNGIDCSRFGESKDPNLAQQYGLNANTLVIGTVAALRPEKNLQRLLSAFQEIPDTLPVRLMIVGDGPERGALETSAKRLGIDERVIFTGYIPDPAAHLTLFDIFALSSDTEQMPISILEAMSAELPIAGVDVGDVKHMVSDVNRPLITARNEESLCEALSRLVANSDLRASIGQANRLHVQAVYNEDDMVKAYARIFST